MEFFRGKNRQVHHSGVCHSDLSAGGDTGGWRVPLRIQNGDYPPRKVQWRTAAHCNHAQHRRWPAHMGGQLHPTRILPAEIDGGSHRQPRLSSARAPFFTS